jgi:hypothetical protein
VTDATGSLHGFPASLTSFVGRAPATAEIAAQLAEYRLVTLTGPGGAGKTWLVGHVARRVAGRFADGVWLARRGRMGHPLPSSPYGAATVTNDVVFTTTFHGDLYALDGGTGKILLKTPPSAGTNAPVAVDGDYVIAGAGASLVPSQQRMIIAYKLGATGKLPDTVSS